MRSAMAGVRASALGAALLAAVVGTLVPADAAVEQQWVRVISTPSFEDGQAVAIRGNTVAVAGLTGGGFGQQNQGGFDGFVGRRDLGGNVVWTRSFGTSGTEFTYGVAVSADAIYVTGSTSGTFAGETKIGFDDAYLRKYDLDGTHLWTRQFGTALGEHSAGVAVRGGAVYVLGETQGAFPGESSAGGADAFLARFDPAGTMTWVQQFGSAGSDYTDSVAVSSAGVFVVGDTDGTLPGQTSAGDRDVFVGRFGTGGDVVWLRQFGTGERDAGGAVAALGSRIYVAASVEAALPGQTYSGDGGDGVVRRYTAAGATVWTRQFGVPGDGSEPVTALAATPAGVQVAGDVNEGAFPGEAAAGMEDGFVRRYSVEGRRSWTHQFGTDGEDQVGGVAASPAGVYVIGSTAGDWPGQPPATIYDAYLTRLRWYRPDATISTAAASGYVGDDRYGNTGDGQSKASSASTGQKRRFFIGVQNDGDSAEPVRVKGCASSTGFGVRYFGTKRGADEITTSVVSGTHVFSLAPGSRKVLRVEVSVTPAANPCVIKECRITVRSTSDPTQRDTALARVKAKA
jgi:hypothetical protein